MFKFEKLTVWQKSLDFADAIYEATRDFPSEEKFGLTNQIRRAGVSVPSNIAEGSARPDPDFAKFLGYATGSLYDSVTQAFIASRRQFLSEADFSRLYTDAAEISRMLSGRRDSLNR